MGRRVEAPWPCKKSNNIFYYYPKCVCVRESEKEYSTRSVFASTILCICMFFCFITKVLLLDSNDIILTSNGDFKMCKIPKSGIKSQRILTWMQTFLNVIKIKILWTIAYLCLKSFRRNNWDCCYLSCKKKKKKEQPQNINFFSGVGISVLMTVNIEICELVFNVSLLTWYFYI